MQVTERNADPKLNTISMAILHGIRIWLHLQIFSVFKRYASWVCLCYHHHLQH